MKSILPYIVIASALAMLTGCKTTEANYRAAYEATVHKRQQASGVDSTLHSIISNETPKSYLTVGSDSLPLKVEYIGYTENSGATRENTCRYNIVVGQFKQLFNAQAMRKRLIDSGYDARLLHTREPIYFVVASSCNTPEEAQAQYQRILYDKKITLPKGMPFILQPAHFGK